MLFFAKNETRLLNNLGPTFAKHLDDLANRYRRARLWANPRLVGLAGVAATAAAALGLKPSARASYGDQALSEADENQTHHPRPARAAKPLSALRV